MIAAVIPTRYHPPALSALLAVLDADGVTPLVMESDAYDHRIYAMWNAGVGMARALGARHVAICNDDIDITTDTLPVMGRALDANPAVGVVYPDTSAPWLRQPYHLVPTTGTWGAGGMTGFCFMFRTSDPLPAFDEGFGWWYGDDAFEAAVRAAGLTVCRVVGLPIRHTANGSAGRDWERLGPQVEQDRARWEAMA